MAPPERPSLQRKRVWVNPDSIITDQQEFDKALRTLGLANVLSRVRANVYVVNNVLAPGQRNQWCGLLGGGILCTPRYITSHGLQGTAVVYKRATAKKRYFWLTPGFAAAHTEVTPIIKSFAAMTASMWRPLASREDAIAKAIKYRRTKNDCELFVLLTAAEQRSEDPSPM